MSIDEVRDIWRIRSDAKTKEVMAKYEKQKAGRSGGREGLGIYGQFQSRVAREKIRLERVMHLSDVSDQRTASVSRWSGAHDRPA
jgi:hypothetical protein